MDRSIDFDTYLATLDLDAHGEVDGGAATLVPPSMRDVPASEMLETLPRIVVGEDPRETPDLRFLRTLGEGGMGLVKLARQVALRRDVAVKTTRTHDPQQAARLLQEAYVTGGLEHPNIVPVYTLGQDDGGVPLLVLKRIDGVSWQSILDDPDGAPSGVATDLKGNLEVLLHVCNALRYAHGRHIIHRDIKPENVMIGEFGEVYLLDWGIAISIAADPQDAAPFPHRDEATGMAGTPLYMAPEMTEDDAANHDVRTDVYLLGACLHHLLTGRPPHDGATVFDVLRAAFENREPRYAASVPSELAAIARRAMASEPAARFQSVDEFRTALIGYIAHQGAASLFGEARHLMARLAELVATPQEDEKFLVHDLFTQARFACEQGLRSWPESPEGHRTLEELLDLQFAYAVDVQDVVQADGIVARLEELGRDTSTMRERVDALRDVRESERRELHGLRAFAAELDLSKGQISRSLAVTLLGVLWSANTLVVWFARGGGVAEHARWHLNSTAAALVIGCFGVFLFRKQLFYSNAANRRLAFTICAAIVALLVVRILFWQHPIDVSVARGYEAALYGVVTMIAGLMLDDLRISLVALLYFVAAILLPYFGPDGTLLVGLCHLIVFLAVAWFWMPAQFARRWRV